MKASLSTNIGYTEVLPVSGSIVILIRHNLWIQCFGHSDGSFTIAVMKVSKKCGMADIIQTKSDILVLFNSSDMIQVEELYI